MTHTEYQVIVGNVGTIYRGPSWKLAVRDFQIYAQMSQNLRTAQCYGEDVVLLQDSQVVREHCGHCVLGY